MLKQPKKRGREMEVVVNISGAPARFKITRGEAPDAVPDEYELMPGEFTEIEAAYARPMQSAPGRDPAHSKIHLMTGGRVRSINDPEASRFKARYEAQAAAERDAEDNAQPETPRKGRGRDRQVAATAESEG